MNAKVRGLILGVATFYITVLVISVFRRSPPSVALLVGSGLVFGFALLWAYFHPKNAASP